MNEIGHQFSCLVNSFHLAATGMGKKNNNGRLYSATEVAAKGHLY